MNKYALSFLLLFTLGQTGCNSNPSSKTQPEIEHNQNIQNPIAIGMARSEFISKVITPSSSKLIGDQRVDTFIFYKRSSASKQYGHALYNGLMAGYIKFEPLVEKLTIPESPAKGDKVIIQVIYDSLDRVEKVVRIQ